MMRNNAVFGLWLMFALTGCVGSIAPIADSSATDDALLGSWRACAGTQLEVTRSDANWASEGYTMRVTRGQTRLSGTYRLFIQRIGDEEFADVFYAPREAGIAEFPAVHVIALIRHDDKEILVGLMNPELLSDEHLKGSGLQVVDIGNYRALILGTSSDLRTFLAAHAREPAAFPTTDEDLRLRRQWAASEGCRKD
jgi:hypothetical protein